MAKAANLRPARQIIAGDDLQMPGVGRPRRSAKPQRLVVQVHGHGAEPPRPKKSRFSGRSSAATQARRQGIRLQQSADRACEHSALEACPALPAQDAPR